LKQIDLENWEQSPDNPRELVYAGQRKAQEVFAELKHRLESVGMLPDEYFLFDSEWENGREMPKDADIFSTVQYGASEGIYLNVSISWNDETKRNIKSFATGKTLGESESHLDRMHLTASAVNKAFYSNEPHARYIKIGGEEKALENSVLHLNGTERQLMIDSLIEMRNNNPQDINAVEQLLRRVAGSITEFVNEVGARPLQISDYDMAVLAVQDGNLAVFNDLYKTLPDKMDDLLICAAARPGKVGMIMTNAILQEAKNISNEAYLAACKNAVTAGNSEKALLLADKADKCVADLDMGLYGTIIGEAMLEQKMNIAYDLVKQCTPEQMQAAKPYILTQAVNSSHSRLAFAMAEKKIDATHYVSKLIHALKYSNNDWMLKILYERGMEMNPKNIPAMQACIKVGSVEMGKVLIDRGMNFEQFEQFAANNSKLCETNETFSALKQYWEAANPPAKTKSLAEKMQAANEKVKAQGKQPTNTKSRKPEERE
jgi:hypothetical protein